MRSLLLLIISTCSCLYVQAQDSYVHTWALKGDLLQLTESETSVGASAEYRFSPQLALQMGAGYSFEGMESAIVSSSGFRLRPEIRIYLATRRGRMLDNPVIQGYIGMEMNFKRVASSYSKWTSQQSNNGASFQRLLEYEAVNLAYGPMFRGGWQLFLGAGRNILVDLGLGAGVAINSVSYKTPSNEEWMTFPTVAWNRPFSNNIRNGLSPCFSLDLRIGYRFSKKT